MEGEPNKTKQNNTTTPKKPTPHPKPLHTLQQQKAVASREGEGKKEGREEKKFSPKVSPRSLKRQAFIPNNSFLTHLGAASHLKPPPLFMELPVDFFCRHLQQPRGSPFKGQLCTQSPAGERGGERERAEKNLNCEICFKKKKKSFPLAISLSLLQYL